MYLRLCSLAWLTAVLALAGCGMYANIPDQTGDIASSNPNNATVRQVMVEAVRAVLAEEPIRGSFNVVLPEGTRPATYDKLLPKISYNAVWTSGGNTPEGPVVAVRQVRVRGTRAEVDVERPAFGEPGELPVLVTAYLDLDLVGGWNVDKLRIWRAGVTPEVEPIDD